jgi:hypothetical protein
MVFMLYVFVLFLSLLFGYLGMLIFGITGIDFIAIFGGILGFSILWILLIVDYFKDLKEELFVVKSELQEIKQLINNDK